MRLLEGRKGLIFGVANDRSIAWYVAQQLAEHGATCAFTYLPGEKNLRRVRKTLESGGLGNAWLEPCDAAKDEDLDAVFAKAKADFDTLDFLVHSIAYAEREYLRIGTFARTPRHVFTQALDISAYTLVAMARRAQGLMPRGGSIIGMTYYGSEKVVPAYNVMGVAKAALEACTRYLAAELGEFGIRVNTISAGPLRTLSSMAVGGVDDMFDWVAKKSPLKRNILPEEVGKAALYLLSDLSSGVTGENLYVDAGYNIIGL
ncbi:MAG: enoyl-ACP reductase [Planctomycetota bacterium]